MISKFKRFLTITWRSAIDFSYYKDIVKAPFSFSLKYLFFLSFVINIVSGIIFSQTIFKFIPQIPEKVEQIKKIAKEFYPDDLIITLNNGKLRTNVDEPYFIEFPANSNTDKNLVHLITIDTKASVEDIKKYKTAVLVTDNALVFPDKNAGYRIQFLSDIKGYYSINQHTYNMIISKFFPYLNYLPYVAYTLIIASILIFPFFMALLSLFGHLIYVLIMGLALWLMVKLMKLEMSYGKIIQLSLHGLTIPIVFSIASQWFNFSMPNLSYSLIFLLLMTVCLSKLKEKVAV